MSDRSHRAPRGLTGSMRLAGAIPLPIQRGLAYALARLFRLLRLREWRVATRNLELCFPAMGTVERQTLAHRSLQATALTLLESLRLWTRPAANNLRLIREIEGEALLDAALAGDAGTVIAAPHLGNWELLNQYLASRAELAIVYRPPRQAWLESLLLHGRGVPGVTQVRAEPAAVRTLLKRLQRGGMVGILPDQQPKRGEGEFSPFFGVSALTMTLLPRLARRTGAAVLLAFAERENDGRFVIRISRCDDDVRDGDPQRATAALNRSIEDAVRRAPAQYQWSYKRFSLRPDGEPPRY